EKRVRVQAGHQKASALIQAAIHRLSLQDFHLKMEQVEILDQAQRVLQALTELAIKSGKGKLLYSAAILMRAINTRVWETGEPGYSLLMQLPNVDAAAAKRLQGYNIHSLQVSVFSCVLVAAN